MQPQIIGLGRGLFVRMLDAFANKLHALKRQIPKLLQASSTDNTVLDQLKGKYLLGKQFD
jgi:hypothetical protein